MPRRAAAALSVAEMYALVDAYAAHRTAALARALMATVKADCDRSQERERSAARRAEEKECLESLTEEQRREEIRKRRATRQKRARSQRYSESQRTRSSGSEPDYSDADTGIHSTGSKVHTPEPSLSPRAGSRNNEPRRKRSCRAKSAPTKHAATSSVHSVDEANPDEESASVQSVRTGSRNSERESVVSVQVHSAPQRPH
ncbi:hypothetical protein QAD02_009922 [Eretmocerus hayati]|uniref:Uncharacterized protein n=1 Tax=Eretmocerus hayati TaxID=131215 RepID=A0ACC2NAN3_9HYME|nr:hypothetical protein QAD02_009922 [Eretmocerus hayati]